MELIVQVSWPDLRRELAVLGHYCVQMIPPVVWRFRCASSSFLALNVKFDSHLHHLSRLSVTSSVRFRWFMRIALYTCRVLFTLPLF